MVKNLFPVKETQVGEGPLEKEMSTHSSILAWEIWARVDGVPKTQSQFSN